MKQYKITLHYNMNSPVNSSKYLNRTFIWDEDERPVCIKGIVRKRITKRMTNLIISQRFRLSKSSSLDELKTSPLGRLWIQSLNESKVGEYKTKP